MGVLHHLEPTGGHQTVGTANKIVSIPMPARCFITRLNVVQVGGSDNFTVNLFHNAQAAAGNPNFDKDNHTLPPELFRLWPELNGTSGKLHFSSESYGIPFCGAQENNSTSALGRSKLFLVLKVPSAGPSDTKEFAISLTIDVDNL